MWFLFQYVLSYMAKNIPKQLDYLLLQSKTKVFSLFKFKVKFDNDEVIGVWIQRTHLKTLTCQR